VSSALLSIGLKIFLSMALGFALRKTGSVSEKFAADGNRLLMLVISPCAMIASAGEKFSHDLARQLALAAIIMGAYFLILTPLMALLKKALPIGHDRQRMFVNLTVFPNTGFIGFPVASELFGAKGLLCAVIMNLLFNLWIFTYGAKNLTHGANVSWREILVTPVMICSVLALVLFFLPWRLPSPVQDSISLIGDTMTPLAMMVVGMSLADTYLPKLLRDGWAYLTAAIRLAVIPLALTGVFWLIGQHGLAAQVAVVLLALPCGNMNVIQGSQYGIAYDFAVHTVIMTNFLMFVTLPFIILLGV
jgi:predicted permease